MPHWTRSSGTSAACRLEWRPSRWLIGALAALSLLAACSVIASELPRALAWLLAIGVPAYGAWLARREARKPVRQFFWAGNDAAVTLDGQPIDGVSVQWRGPLAFVCWCNGDGRVQRLGWWPDTLPAARRRELRLAAGDVQAVPGPPSMAP